MNRIEASRSTASRLARAILLAGAALGAALAPLAAEEPNPPAAMPGQPAPSFPAAPSPASLSDAPDDAALRALDARIARLEAIVGELRAQKFGAEAGASLGGSAAGEAGPTPAAARLMLRLDGLERSVLELTGKLESLQYDVRSANARLDTFAGDVEFRLTTLEGGTPAMPAQGTAEAGGLPAPLASSSGGVPVPRPAPGALAETPALGIPSEAVARGAKPLGTVPLASLGGTDTEDFRAAFNLMANGQFAEAEGAFRDFLEIHPKSALKGDAQFWLGESLFVRGSYAEAATAFLKGVRDNPKGTKAPDSLLKLGMALGKLNQTSEACSAFGELKDRYPNAPAKVTETARREAAAIGCP
ncbi:MAG: tol-pal system protein YbgF [Alphaproteobacteria bacterium]|nr:tol-pal system protein YbgF [Alphaproteobacteria bacterium]